MTSRRLTGLLLVATPLLEAPEFRRTVVLILDHNDEGALGVVINRATTTPVGAVLESWADAVSDPAVLFAGGPVATDSALAVGRTAHPAQSPAGWRQCFGRTGLVDLDTPVDVISTQVPQLRIFAGYAGWGSEQLEAEIAEGSWYLVTPVPEDVFALDTSELWRKVLRRQPDSLAYVSTYPDDPSMN